MIDQLKELSIDVIIDALMKRENELFMEDNPGLLISPAFKLRMMLGAIACVDGMPFRYNKNGEVELMAIRRFSGAFPGKLVLEGGTIAKDECKEDTLRRHFREDLGVEIKIRDVPFYDTQYHRGEPDKNWMQDPGKDHNVAPVYFVEILSDDPIVCKLGSVEWFSEKAMPPDDDFGYTNHRIYRRAFEAIEKSSKS